jgi:hypothetical protein
MARPAKTTKDTHPLLLQVPNDFWDEMVTYFNLRKSYTSYAELGRHLMRIGLDNVKGKNDSGKRREANT